MMSQVRNTHADVRPVLARLLAPVAADMAEVERRLERELRHPDPFIDELAQHSFRLGGKRLRPALLLLSAQAVGQINDEHRTLAAVVEMVHTATLVHDDVLDEAQVRRHRDTVNARWSNQTSVLLGDYLFTHAFHLASTIGDWGLDVEGYVETPGNNAKGDWQVATDGAFEALGERLVAGRWFTAADRAEWLIDGAWVPASTVPTGAVSVSPSRASY